MNVSDAVTEPTEGPDTVIETAARTAISLVATVDAPWLYAQVSEEVPDQDIASSKLHTGGKRSTELLLYDRENENAWARSTLYADPQEIPFE